MHPALFAILAAVTFVTPQEGSQAIGPQVIEVATDAAVVDRVEFHVDGVLVGVARSAPYRTTHDFGTELESRTITAKVLSDGYRRTDSASIRTASLTAGETMNVDLVEVPMRIRSRRVLRASDIRLEENSLEHSIREILPGRGSAHFAFVVDRSLSMTGGRLEAAIEAVNDAKRLLRDGDTSSLVLFSHHVSAAQPLAKIRLTPSGGTSLRDAVASTLDSRNDRTYVVVITDGGDRNSVLSEEAALRTISGTKTVVSAIVLGKASSFMKRATSTTGGELLRSSKANLAQQVERVLADINSRYTVVYQSRGTRSGWRSIAVEPRRSGIEIVAARKGYFAE